MNLLKMKLFDQSGMTLIEILIIIIIISVLAITASVQYADLSESANTAKCKANQGALQTAVTSFWVIELEYPQDIDDLVPYMKDSAIPECPSGGEYELIDHSEVTCSLAEHQ